MSRLAILLLLPQLGVHASGAGQGTAGWARVENLRLGQQIRVLCSGRQAWTGRLANVSAGALVLEVGGTERKVLRSEILKLQAKSRVKSALIGLGIGAAAGVGIGYAAGSAGNLNGGQLGAATALGAGLFAAGGAAVGSIAPAWKTVYEAEPPGAPRGSPSRPK